MEAAFREFTFRPDGKWLSEKVIISEAHEDVGYSLIGQYVTYNKRRIIFVHDHTPLKIYYTPRAYMSLTNFKNTTTSAEGTLLYKNESYHVKKLLENKDKQSISVFKNGELLGAMQVNGKFTHSLSRNSGLIRLYGEGMQKPHFLLSMLFAGRYCFALVSDD